MAKTQIRSKDLTQRKRLHIRLRKKVRGTADRPRLCVSFSGKHIRAQVIDDDRGVTVAAASTLDKAFRGEGKKAMSGIAFAVKVGRTVAQKALEKKISQVVFDRGGFKYHGRVKALADAAREAGLKF